MLSKETLKKIRRIQITTSHMVTDVFAGQYKSVFKGKGMEFDEVREYQPGDEIRSIDWNVTARTGHPYVKKFVEERELTVMFLLDVSPSSSFGSVNQLKSRLAAEICSLLAFSAVKSNDKVGLIAFTDRIERFVPPRKGSRHVLRVIREALFYSDTNQADAVSKGTDIPNALEYLNGVTSRRTVAFLLSDFYNTDFQKQLSIANKRHDIVAVTVTDPRETDLPDVGIIQLEDPETGRSFVVDTSDAKIRGTYRKNAQRKLNDRKKAFQLINVDNIDIRTDEPYLQALIRFFRMREKRMR